MGAMALQAQDWTQWRGENREGVVKQAGLNLDWEKKKPPLLWTYRQAGVGFSSPSVAGTTLYMTGSDIENDFAFAVDTRTGKELWKQVVGERFRQEWGDGPRGSITIDGNRLYLILGTGQILCLSAADGKIVWQKNFITDFGGKIMSDWGYSESPLIDGNLVVCTPGGGRGTMVALDKNTGNLVWQSKEWTDDAGYSSPIVAVVHGTRQYIQQSSKGVAGVSAADGKLLWRVANPGYQTAVIPTPVYHDNTVFVSSGYNAGCMYIRLAKEGNQFKAETVYSNNVMTNQHGGVVLMNGHIYGFSDVGGWVCQNLATGAQAWVQARSAFGGGKGTVLGVNDRLIVMEERQGTMAVLAASPDGWKEFGRVQIPERTKIQTRTNSVWAHLVIADGKLYLRDQDLLFCFDLK